MTDEQQPRPETTQRDVETLYLIGGFLTFFAMATLAGSFWPMSIRARVVNTVAGLVLLGLGLGTLYWAKCSGKSVRDQKSLREK
jgi:hypothetical protein